MSPVYLFYEMNVVFLVDSPVVGRHIHQRGERQSGSLLIHHTVQRLPLSQKPQVRMIIMFKGEGNYQRKFVGRIVMQLKALFREGFSTICGST